MNLKEKLINYGNNKNKNIKNNYIKIIKEKSINIFKKLGVSSLNNNEWKKIMKYNFSFEQKNFLTYDYIKKHFINTIDSFKIVFINGEYCQILSDVNTKIKYINILSSKFNNQNDKYIIENYYNKISSKIKNSFSLLNTALSNNGICIYIPKNINLEKPIQLLYISSVNDNLISFPRNLIIIDENSNVKIIEEHKSINNKNVIFNNSVTEIYLKEKTYLDYNKIQNDSDSLLIDNTFVIQEKYSYASFNTFSLSGINIKNNITIYQNGVNANSYLNGLIISKKNNIIDNNTSIHHLVPNCKSYELYKSILYDKSNVIFNGKIIVYKNAQKIKAFQRNDNILLSNKASINTNPQLEIFANDVKCSHGCTIGVINHDHIFYLRTRGISKKDAKNILLLTFIEDILKNINLLDLKIFLKEKINKKLLINYQL